MIQSLGKGNQQSQVVPLKQEIGKYQNNYD